MSLERRAQAEYFTGFDPEAFAAQLKKQAAAAAKAAEPAIAATDTATDTAPTVEAAQEDL
ncbi:hypothetical protein [Corynebacterium caspium]|uniref:hypothetical protein n=1 Tax=Corynebacterium caspium TaxID=234828 RepID=UPI00037E1C0F|nr:hypothetical protein [Corynebacterium caspium]WKD59656.1 hypothetical protein CCASP_06365 [Corynebacterium caspium DSM 44850]